MNNNGLHSTNQRNKKELQTIIRINTGILSTKSKEKQCVSVETLRNDMFLQTNLRRKNDLPSKNGRNKNGIVKKRKE